MDFMDAIYAYSFEPVDGCNMKLGDYFLTPSLYDRATNFARFRQVAQAQAQTIPEEDVRDEVQAEIVEIDKNCQQSVVDAESPPVKKCVNFVDKLPTHYFDEGPNETIIYEIKELPKGTFDQLKQMK